MTIVKRDTISTIYKELFTIKFLHEGYGILYKKFLADNIDFELDKETENLFFRHSIDFRFLNDKLICFIRVKEPSPPIANTKQPFIKFLGNVKIRFLLNATTSFFSESDITITGAKQVYYFTNKVNIATDGFICMHTAGVNMDDLANTEILKPDKNCFSVIDIFNNGAVNNSYDLFDGTVSQILKSPSYTIRFKSKT